MTGDFILDFWESQAQQFGTAADASWGDQFAVDLEVEAIANELRDGDRVLDVGCANAHATLRQWKARPLKSIVGIDFSPAMIAAAKSAHVQSGLVGDIEFSEGDVRALAFGDSAFDVVYTTRVLINLPTWKQQVTGIEECLRVVRPGGKVVLSEAFWEPLCLLNAIRALCGLAPLVEHDFNRYLKKDRLEAWLKSRGLPFRVEEFSSVYYLGSRFLRDLVTKADQYPGYSNPVNARFFELEREFSGGGMGIQQAYVIESPA
jgi:ubiquinone/menaquinone biosynthesis C-methylase UbiE